MINSIIKPVLIGLLFILAICGYVGLAIYFGKLGYIIFFASPVILIMSWLAGSIFLNK